MATIRTHFFHRPEECDSFQPCFFDHEDVEFYGTRAPMTSDEIWDKFELLPTPPRSPNRDPLPDISEYSSSLLDIEAERLHLQPLVSDDLLREALAEFIPEAPKQCFPESPPPLITGIGLGGLNSKLIQDCMWSGKNVQPFIDPCVEKKKGEKSDVTNCSSRKNNRCDHLSGLDSSISSDCVDPSVVFPYPINREYPDIDTPSDSGNEEEEDEEIDVVNVEKTQVPQLPHKRRVTPVIRIPEKVVKKSLTHVASLLLPAVHACHTYSKQMPVGRNYEHVSRSTNSSPVHNHSATHRVIKRTSVSISMPSSPRHHRPSKRAKRHLATPAELKRVAQKLKSCSSSRNVKTEYYSSSSSCSSRVGSDSEGETGPGGKRTQHNVLERKRRNDLKYSFFKLRDAVPELCQQERAPKVVILKKATDYINDLTFKQNCLVSEYERQRARRHQLRETLQLLHDS